MKDTWATVEKLQHKIRLTHSEMTRKYANTSKLHLYKNSLQSTLSLNQLEQQVERNSDSNFKASRSNLSMQARALGSQQRQVHFVHRVLVYSSTNCRMSTST